MDGTAPAPSPQTSATRARGLDAFFGITTRRSRVTTECIGGATTFVTAAYLTIVIPSILATAGMDRAAATTATIVMFVIGTVGMALYARLPLVVGPGIGGAALVATTLEAYRGRLGSASASGRACRFFCSRCSGCALLSYESCRRR